MPRTRTHRPYHAGESDPAQAWRHCSVSQAAGVGTGLGAIASGVDWHQTWRPPGLPSHARLPVSPTTCPGGPGPSGLLLLNLQDLVLEAARPRGKQAAQGGVIEAGEAGHDGQPVQEAQVAADDEDHLRGDRLQPLHLTSCGDARAGVAPFPKPVLIPGAQPPIPPRPLALPPSDWPRDAHVPNDLRGGLCPAPLVRPLLLTLSLAFARVRRLLGFSASQPGKDESVSVAAVTVTSEQQAQRAFLDSQPRGPAARPSLGRGLDGAPAAPLDQDWGVRWCVRLCQPGFHHGVTRHEASPGLGLSPGQAACEVGLHLDAT